MSENAPTDRRIRRTKKLLGEAIVDLVIKKGYENVTIQDITNKADIGYRTFFRHFPDKESLLVHVLNSTAQELNEMFSSVSPKTSPETNGKILFQYVQERVEIFRVLLLTRNTIDILDARINKTMEGIAHGMNLGSDKELDLNMIASHIVGSMFCLIDWWLKNDQPHPPEKMGIIFDKLIVAPSIKLLGNS